MSVLGYLPILAILSSNLFGEPVTAVETPNEKVRQSVQRSLPYIAEEGTWWIEEKDCSSCHRVNTMVWSLNDARRNGFTVRPEMDDWTKWVVEESLGENEEGKIVGLSNKEGVAQILLGLENESRFQGSVSSLVNLLQEGQQDDGSWKAGGQLPTQKRPAAETDVVSTAWITLALARFGDSEKTRTAIQRATKFLGNSKPGISTEWYVVQLLLAMEQGDRMTGERLVKQLGELQHPDGGWGWLVKDPSDALGTGMALYALSQAGVPSDDPRIQQAQQFLVDTQLENGAWEVKGTKAKKQTQIQETATYWGTTWASLGLMASLPE